MYNLAKRHRQFLADSRNTHGDTYDYSRVEYVNNDTPVVIICPHHGPFEQRPRTHIYDKSGCPACRYENAKKHPADYHNLAKKRGYKWLGSVAEKVTDKTSWQCEKGHTWEATYNNIRIGTACPYCTKNIKTPEDYHAAASQRGYKWLGPFPKSTSGLTWWQCPAGHKIRQKYNSFVSRTGCPKCRKIQPDKFIQIAAGYGFRIEGKLPDNTADKVTFVCENGHKWETTFASIHYHKTGCPLCRMSKGERKIEQLLIDLGLEYKTQKRFKGCKDKSLLPFDFYVQSNGKMALIEYHGQQHYKPHKTFFGGVPGFQGLQKRDRIKSAYCETHGIPLIIVPYWQFNNLIPYLTRKLMAIIS